MGGHSSPDNSVIGLKMNYGGSAPVRSWKITECNSCFACKISIKKMLFLKVRKDPPYFRKEMFI